MDSRTPEPSWTEVFADGPARAVEICRLMHNHKGPISVHVRFSFGYVGPGYCWEFVAGCPDCRGTSHEIVTHEVLMNACPNDLADVLARRLLVRLAYTGSEA